MVGLLAFAGSTFAATTSGNFGGQRGFPQQPSQFQRNNQQGQGVFGTVTEIDGTNLTVQSKGFGPNSATTTYSVDASKAKIENNRATSTISSISVGNSVMIQGTVSGTSVTATRINLNSVFGEGDRQNQTNGFGQKNASSTMQRKFSSSTNMMEGNGQPIIGGTVSAINGTSISITNKSNTSYTIDASSAILTKENNKISVSDIVVGDSVLVQGTINGTSVVASTITDQSFKAADTNAVNNNVDNRQKSTGFFGGIGNFFAKLFGF
jgi:hypothetical protein